MTLSVRELTVRYDGLTAVDRVSFDIDTGESMALVGESGCGKTSIAHTLLGLLPASAQATGSARLGTDELVGRTDWTQIRGRRIAIVPQGAMSGLSPVHRTGAQLAEMINLHGGSARPEELLDRVHLHRQMLRSYPHELSGGQRQRVAIALALAGEPDVLVADEPTTGLDVITEREMLTLLAGLGVSMLMISHNLGVLRHYSDRIAVMYAGRLAEVRPTATLAVETAHPYTVGLLTSTPLAERDIPWGSVPGSAPPLGAIRCGCRFAPRCPLAIDHCRDEEPQLVAYGEAQVACHRHAEQETPPYPVVPRAEQSGGESVASVTGLRHVYRTRARAVDALRKVDLTIAAGEIVGLVGESGSGKSTLARIMMGLIQPVAGRVEIDGTAMTASRRTRRRLQRRIGFVHQDPYDALHPGMRVSDLVAEPLVISRVPRSKRLPLVEDALDAAGLPNDRAFLRRHPGLLSGGQRQRISIARALVAGPILLVADEATSMLDVSTRAGIATTLRTLAEQRRLAVLFITHDLGEAVQSCDRIVVLQAGRVVEHARAVDLSRSPSHAYTAQLLEAAQG